jgi:hypothetical protein
LPGSTLAPRGATGGYVIAYAVTLASFIVIWFNHPILLYIGRDANFTLWLGKAYADWAYPLDVTAMNPFQGMTSMLMPINPYFNPGTWIFQAALPEVPSRVASFIVYFLEVTASAFLLGVALGFSRLFAFVGALWLAFLLFPPFNFVYGLQGWLATNPPYGHTLALSNLILVAFIRIGAESPTAPGFGRRLARNWLLASCIFVLVLLIILAAPFYNGGMLIGTFLLTGVIFLSSQSISQVVWRLAAGIYVLACCAAVGFFGFFAGAQAYSARFSGTGGWLPQFHWPVEFSPGLIANARQGLCAWGVVCDRLAQGPLALTGSYWLQLSIIVGAIAVAIRMRPPLARVGALFAVLWIVLLVAWSSANLGIISAFPLSPTFFFLMMYPFWAFFSLYAGVRLIEITTSRFVPKARSADPAWFAPPFAWRLSRSSRFSAPISPACSSGAAFRSAPRRRLRKLCSGTSRCVPARPTADRSLLSSVLRGVRCGISCSTMPSVRCSPRSLKDFLKSWPAKPATATTCSIWVAPYSDLVGIWPGPLQAPHILHLEPAQRADGRALELWAPPPSQYRHLEGNGRPIHHHGPPATGEPRARDTGLPAERWDRSLSLRAVRSQCRGLFALEAVRSHQPGRIVAADQGGACTVGIRSLRGFPDRADIGPGRAATGGVRTWGRTRDGAQHRNVRAVVAAAILALLSRGGTKA